MLRTVSTERQSSVLCTAIISALQRQRQEDHSKFEASLAFTMISRPT